MQFLRLMSACENPLSLMTLHFDQALTVTQASDLFDMPHRKDLSLTEKFQLVNQATIVKEENPTGDFLIVDIDVLQRLEDWEESSSPIMDLTDFYYRIRTLR